MKKVLLIILLTLSFLNISKAEWKSYGPSAMTAKVLFNFDSTLYVSNGSSVVPYYLNANRWSNEYYHYSRLSNGFTSYGKDVYVYGYNYIIKSGDKGKTWSLLNKKMEGENPNKSFSFDITRMDFYNDTIYIFNQWDHRIWYSPKDSLNWELATYPYMLNKNYNDLTPDSYQKFGDTIVIGMTSGLFVSPDNGRTWKDKSEGLDTNNITKLIYEKDHFFVKTTKSFYECSKDCSKKVKVFESRLSYIWQLKIINNNYFAHNGEKVYKSSDNGLTWKDFVNGLPDLSYYNHVLSMITDDAYVYIGTYRGVYRSPIDSANWTEFNNMLNNGYVGEFRLLNKRILTKFNSSSDQGVTWSNEKSFYSVENMIYDKNSETTFLFLDSSLYASKDDCITWTYINKGISPGLLINSIAIVNDTLYALLPKNKLLKTDCKNIKCELIDANSSNSLPINGTGLFTYKNKLYVNFGKKGISCLKDDKWSEIILWNENKFLSNFVATDKYMFSFPNSTHREILKTTDLNHWDIVHYPFEYQFDNSITPLKSVADMLFFSKDDVGLFKSKDYGETWEICTPAIICPTIINYLDFDSTYIYVATAECGLNRIKIEELFDKPILIEPKDTNELVNKNIMLRWKSALIIANDKIEISSDSLFKNIAISMNTLQGSINVDQLQPNKKYYWRVVSTYKNGIEKQSDTWSFTTNNIFNVELAENEFFEVTPNPADKSLKLSFNFNADLDYDLYIYSMDGREVYSIHTLNNKENKAIDVSNFANGMYNLVLLFGDKNITRKIIVNHQ